MDGAQFLDKRMENKEPEAARGGYELGDIREPLWDFLKQLMLRFTGGGSGSLRSETVRELLASANYLIGLAIEETHGVQKLSGMDGAAYEVLFEQGIDIVKARLEIGKVLLKRAEETAIDVKNSAYTGVTEELHSFFKQYNYYYFAHDIPCLLDYPPAVPVDEQLKGIDYINTYLRRFVLENEFCRRFEDGAVARVVARVCPDDGLISVYEAAAVRAVALTLVRADVRALDITEDDRRTLTKLLADDTAPDAWLEAARTLAARLGLDAEAAAYLEQTAAAAIANLRRTAQSGSLENRLPSLEIKPDLPAVDTTRYIDGRPMADEELRALMDDITDCQAPAEKAAVALERVGSVRDLFEVLNLCFWDDEALPLFEALDDGALAMVRHQLAERQKNNPDWHSESGWEDCFISFMDSAASRPETD